MLLEDKMLLLALRQSDTHILKGSVLNQVLLLACTELHAESR